MTVAADRRRCRCPCAALIVLDGWGIAPDGPGQRGLARRHAGVRRAVGSVSDDDADRLRAGRRAARRADGQLRGRPPQPRRRQRRDAGPDADRRRGGRRVDGVANPVLRDALGGAERVHVIGLVSDGGVHSSMDHLHALIELAASLEVPDLVVHAFTDGRDTLPRSGAGFLAPVEAGWQTPAPGGSARSSVATTRWTATTAGTGSSSPTTCSSTGEAPHRARFGRGGGDRRLRARRDRRVHQADAGRRREALIRPGDSVLGLNFRPDRMREITRALASEAFDGFDRGDGAPVATRYATMTEYEEGWPYPVAFAPERPATTIGAVIAAPGRAPAARRRDREVSARHVLLQRRRGDAVRRRAARAGALAA